MDNNELLMIVLAFVVGYMASGMMKSMCGGGLVEGYGECRTSWTGCGGSACRTADDCVDRWNSGVFSRDNPLACRGGGDGKDGMCVHH